MSEETKTAPVQLAYLPTQPETNRISFTRYGDGIGIHVAGDAEWAPTAFEELLDLFGDCPGYKDKEWREKWKPEDAGHYVTDGEMKAKIIAARKARRSKGKK